MTFFEIGVLAGGWVFLSAFAALRTRRSLVFLIALSVPFVAVGWLVDPPGPLIVRTAVVLVYWIVTARYLHTLAGMSRVGAKIHGSLHFAYEGVADAQRKWIASWRRGDAAATVANRTDVVQACDSALGTLDEIQQPDDAWREAITLLRKYFLVMKEQAIAGLEANPAPGGDTANTALRALNQAALDAWDHATFPRRR
jgi:hypothetical protein